MSEEPIIYKQEIKNRFRGYLPIVIDVETGGLNPDTDALLEMAAVTLNCDETGKFYPAQTWQQHIEPFPGAILNPDSLAINKIDPSHPFRFAIYEHEALTKLFAFIRPILKQTECKRCVLVGHNAWFDLAFINAAISRTKVKNSPFHSFTSFDTATLGGIFYGHTTLSELLKRADIPHDNAQHHSAIYDAEQTAKLFCKMLNQNPWPSN